MANLNNRSKNIPSKSKITIHKRRAEIPKRKQQNERKPYRPIPSDLFNNLFENVKVPVKKKAVSHIWKRHGCYENAEIEQTIRRNRGKMPSHFRSPEVLIKAVASTVNRPNWTRSGNIEKDGKFRYKKAAFKTGGIERFRGKNCRKNLNKRKKKKKQSNRILHFKLFTITIGYSGQGYGGQDESECCCCCAVVCPIYGLVTSYPILTEDAENKGDGEITTCQKDRSSITTSSDEFDENKSNFSSENGPSFHLMSVKSISAENEDINEGNSD